MATPRRVPAGWCAGPPAGHERRYWAGTDWTAQVSDGGLMAIDQPGSRPAPESGRPAEPPPAAGPPAAGPPAAAPAPRKRRTWAVPVAVAVVVLGLIAGLLIWAPWKSPPLLRPAGLTAGAPASRAR